MDNEEFNMEVEMERLHLNSFLHVAADSQSARHRIFAGLNIYRHELNHNRLFPAFSELVELNTGLCTLLEQHEEFIRDLPRDIESLDWENRIITYKKPSWQCTELQRVLELAEWSLPFIDHLLNEGKEIFDFVEEHPSLEEVGIAPLYRDEGFCFVPEQRAGLFHVRVYHSHLSSYLHTELEQITDQQDDLYR